MMNFVLGFMNVIIVKFCRLFEINVTSVYLDLTILLTTYMLYRMSTTHPPNDCSKSVVICCYWLLLVVICSLLKVVRTEYTLIFTTRLSIFILFPFRCCSNESKVPLVWWS